MSRFSTCALILVGAFAAIAAAAYDHPRPVRADTSAEAEVGYVLAGFPPGGKKALLPSPDDGTDGPVQTVDAPTTAVHVD